MESNLYRRTNSHDHWYLHRASVLLKHTVLYPFIYCLVNSQRGKVWRTDAEERQDCADHQERWIEIHTLNVSHCRAVRTLLYAETLYAIHCQLCTAALEKYTLWSRSILQVWLIVCCSSPDVGPGKFGSWALEEACYNKVVSPSKEL